MATELLTVREAAARLKVHPHTLRRWIREGVLPGSKVGRKEWRVREEDLEQHLQPPRASSPAPENWAKDIFAFRREMKTRLTAQEVAEIVAEARRDLEARGVASSATGNLV